MKVGTFKEYGRYIEDIRKLYARNREGISKVYPELVMSERKLKILGR